MRKMVKKKRQTQVDVMLSRHLKGAHKLFVETLRENGINRVSDDNHDEQIKIVLKAQKKMMNLVI